MPEKIICPTTKWFSYRILGMVALFTAGFLWFIYDAGVGYPKKNLSYYYHQTFLDAGDIYRELKANNEFSEYKWQELVTSSPTFKDVDPKELPKGTDLNQTWPSVLLDYQSIDDNLSTKLPARLLWNQFVVESGLKSVDVAENAKSADTILWQYISAYIALALAIIALGIYFLMKNRAIVVDQEHITLPSGKTITYREIKKADLRKWSDKGLAYFFYNDGDKEKKARIDGFVFGGFEQESGSAESMMEAFKANFRGEYV